MNRDDDLDRPCHYCIRLKGVLDSKWSAWFEGFLITHREDETILMGSVVDQAALHGLLAKIRDLGLPILSIQWLAHDEALGDEIHDQDDRPVCQSGKEEQ